ncbi:MAG: hypothetical protein IJX99_03285 [Clostridia bacterium]|nr:hypothetical protein [Clostridia bacterium]
MQIKMFMKIIFAGIVSFFLLSILCLFYYNIPVHYSSETGATDYVWEKNKYYVRAGEGFSYGKTDSNGYNNLNIPNQVDILLMGSSQAEGFNVLQDENTAARLNKLLENKLSVYNIGVSGHTFAVCLSNLENAIKAFKPKKYIIIETQAFMTETELNNLCNNSIEEIPSSNVGITAQLQKLDYLRLLYSQYQSYTASRTKNNISVKENNSGDMKLYEEKLNQVLEKAQKLAEEASCELIVFMDDSLKKNENGIVLLRQEDQYYDIYKKVCEKNNIIFVDMYNPFAELYSLTYRLPHGFSNTRVGMGHLNKYGHEVIANTIFEIIKEKEEI